MTVFSRIRALHPGWWIGLFFATLISANIAFFAIAASQDVRMVDASGYLGAPPPHVPGSFEERGGSRHPLPDVPLPPR